MEKGMPQFVMEEIRAQCKKKNWSLEEFADRSEISMHMLQKWETDPCARVPLRPCLRAIAVLDISLEQLLIRYRAAKK